MIIRDILEHYLLLFPETDSKKACWAIFANFDTMFKNWFGHKVQTVSDMSKIFL